MIKVKICVIGLGYIGLPTSIMFAKHGVDVIGVDIRQSIIDSLNDGKIYFEEPGLQDALDEVNEKGKLKASLKPEKADAFIISVPTPNCEDEFKSCDLTYVIQATEALLPVAEKGNVIIVESTIAPRSMEDVIKPLVEEAGFKVGEDIYLVHCPERVLPGKIMYELIHNNRIIGGVTPACTEAGEKIYSVFVKGEMIKTDAKTAEMSKLMENTFRDVNIALANELVKICTHIEVNALDVIEMANKHPRVNIHTPGPGVGGHCLAVDPYFIVSKTPEFAKLIHLSRQINVSMPHFVVENVNKLMDYRRSKVITIFGLTYKGDIDDIRESPAMEIYEMLKEQGKYEIRAYDPYVHLDWVESDIERAVDQSDLLLILTDHQQFKDFTGDVLKKMNDKLIFDTKNIVKSVSTDIEYVNYGNLYEALRKLQIS